MVWDKLWPNCGTLALTNKKIVITAERERRYLISFIYCAMYSGKAKYLLLVAPHQPSLGQTITRPHDDIIIVMIRWKLNESDIYLTLLFLLFFFMCFPPDSSPNRL